MSGNRKDRAALLDTELLFVSIRVRIQPEKPEECMSGFAESASLMMRQIDDRIGVRSPQKVALSNVIPGR
ncbi:hypothetical protein [Methyloligella halotolerans]|uniref:hypothetical protein n=1 Tax=Methyloligella halotolerans TaxID=1177755 RepID=UPI00083DE705|nr:hypothetical protein [Methyloligella halotolerans]